MPLWLAAAPLVLASRSPVRRTLLEAAGVPVEICPADIDERGVEAGAPLQAPVAIAALLAREKASVIAERNRGRLILGAVTERNYPLVQATILMVTIGFVLLNFAIDLIYGFIDPRLRR